MGTNVVFLGWNQPMPGRERMAIEHFGEYMQYLGGLQQAGTIQAFDAVFLNPHGGDLNGFVFIRGDSARLDALLSSEPWEMHLIRAGLELAGLGMLRGVTGELLMQQQAAYTRTIPA